MNKLAFSSLQKGHPLQFESSPSFEKSALVYPVLEVKKLHYTATVERVGDYPHASFFIEATLLVSDTRDGTPFAKTFKIEEESDLLEEDDDKGEGYVFSDGKVDLDALALSLLVASLPLRLTRDDSTLPPSGKGYRVLSQEEAEKEKKETTDPRLSALDDYDVK